MLSKGRGVTNKRYADKTYGKQRGQGWFCAYKWEVEGSHHLVKGNKIKSNHCWNIVVCSTVSNNRKLGSTAEQRWSVEELQKKEWERNSSFF